MIEFHPITLADKEWIDRHLRCEDSPSADFNFGNMFIWDHYYHQQVCDLGGRTLTVEHPEGEEFFVYPIGCGPLRPAVEAMRTYAAAGGWPFVLYGVTARQRELLEAEFPGCFAFTESEDYADYIYEAEKLATYAGKALHGKKNHCNRFEAEHNWRFEKLTWDLFPACEEMLHTWLEDNAGRLEDSIVYEQEAIRRAFRYYEQLELEGGVLIADGEILGFTFGEMTSSDAFNVHIEKAAADVNGAYPMVCRELVRMLLKEHPGLKWINREDDMGLEALRKSKQSYKPAYLLTKYAATWIGD